MATKRSAQTQLERTVGKKVADELLKKVERLRRIGATVAEIEEVISGDLVIELRRRVVRKLVKVGGSRTAAAAPR